MREHSQESRKRRCKQKQWPEHRRVGAAQAAAGPAAATADDEPQPETTAWALPFSAGAPAALAAQQGHVEERRRRRA